MKCVKLRAKKPVMFIPQFAAGMGAGDVVIVVESLAKALDVQFPQVFEEVGVLMKDRLRSGMYQMEKEDKAEVKVEISAVKDAAASLSADMPEPVMEKKTADKSMAAKSKTKRK